MKRDETKPSLKANVILSFLIQIFYFAIPLITVPYLSRVLGPEKIGIYSYAYSYVHYFSLLGVFGFLNYGGRLIAKNRDNLEERNKIFWSVVFTKLVFVCISIAIYLGLVISNVAFKDIDKSILYALLFVLVADAFDITFFYRGIEKLKYASLVTASCKILYTVFIFVFVKTGEDLVVYTLLQSATTFLISLCLWIFAIPRISKPVYSKDVFWPSVKGATGFFLPSIVVGISATFDQTLLGIFSTKVEVGYYQQAYKITTLLAQLICAFTPIILSRVALLRNDYEKNKEEIKAVTTKALCLIFLLIVPALAGLYFTGKDFFPLFFGEEFRPATVVFYLQLPVTLFVALTSLAITSHFFAIGKTKIVTIVIGCCCLLNIGLTALLLNVTNLAAKGAAIATLVSECLSACVLFYFTRKNYDYKHFSVEFLKIFVSTVLMVGVLFVLDLLVLPLFLERGLIWVLLEIFASIIVYFVSLIAFKETITMSLLRAVFQKRKRKTV